MLTKEQIKNLKPGDPIVIHTKFYNLDSDGDVQFLSPYSSNDISRSFISCDYVSLPADSQSSTVNSQSKYDPTRLFKEGDIVKRRTVDGRTDPDVAEGIDLTVTNGEGIYGNVRVQEPNGRSIVTKSVFLELVTPVEELEPFTVVHKQALQHFQINHGKLNYMTFPYGLHKSNGWYHTITTAKAAAEAERDRLNAEYRKEHGND